MPCYFGDPIAEFRYPSTSKFKCNEDFTPLRQFRSFKTVLYGCKDPIDLILLRGCGEVVDWSNHEEVDRVSELEVCSEHLQFLLTQWTSNNVSNKPESEKEPTCSLPFIDHVQPDKRKKNVKTKSRMRKNDVIAFLKVFGIICHPGTYVCSHHLTSLRNAEYDKFKFKDETVEILMETDESTEVVAETHVVDFPSDKSEFSLSSNGDDFVFAPQSSDSDISVLSDQFGEETSPKVIALREIASMFGLSRLSSDRDWENLQPDTQRKKVSAMLSLQEELYKLCAGDGWEAMRNECIRKTGQLVDSSRVTGILQSIDEQLEQTTDRRSRLALVSSLVGHFKEREIIHATGVSRYFVREAKKYALYGLEEILNIRRVKYNLLILRIFVNFLSRPEVIVSLPMPARSMTLSSGDIVTLARVARLHSLRRIVDMYKSFIEMKGIEECAATGADLKEYVKTHSLGYTTCIKIMETVIPVRRVRMQCVDSFQAEALEAFDTAMDSVVELKEKGKIADYEASDLNRRFRVALNYLTGYYRMHLSSSSTCSSHCLNFALSDRSCSEFQSSCDHQHVDSCEQCNDVLSVFAQFRAFLKDKSEIALKNNDADRYRISRMLEECAESEKRVVEYQKHIVRASMTDLDRVSAIENLVDCAALITMDFSLKLMPTGFVESQSQWFGKAGISFHISHVMFKKGDVQYHHTTGHLNDESKQDTVAICVIADHLFKVLAENGVKIATLRSDNAGNYRNADVMHTLRGTAGKYGITLSAYLFSEPQAGKGVADNRISHAKGKIRDVVDSGGYGKDAEQILKCLCTAPLLKAYSFYVIKGEDATRPGLTIPGITNYSSFQYQDDGIRVKRYNTIGEGKLIPHHQLNDVTYPYKIISQGGYLSRDNKVGKLDSCEEEDNNKLKFRCTEENCIAKFLTLRGLNDHLSSEKHHQRKHSDSIIEAAARMFSERVETNETAYLSMKVDSLSSCHSSVRSLKLTEGWAIREKNGTNAIDPCVRRAVRKYFLERRKEGKRAEAKWVVNMLRHATDPTGAYLYPLKKCLKESQAQGLISRFLKVEASKMGLKALESEEEENGDKDEDLGLEDSDMNAMPEEPTVRGKVKPKKINSSAEKKKLTRKATGSAGKKTAPRPQRNKSVESNKKMLEGRDTEDMEEAVPSTAIHEKPTAKKRGRPRKVALDAAKPCGTTSVDTKQPPNVSRNRKRGAEEENEYCEISSDEELDDYTLMMNAIHDNYEDIFSDEE